MTVHHAGSRDPEDRIVKAGDRRARREKMLDKTIADSFPASDPPSSLPDPSEDSFQRELGDKTKTMIKLKRVYEAVSPDDGVRILVERLWPRGIKKTALKIDEWLKDVAPSDGLRRWFGHDPQKWIVFRERYFKELDQNPEVWQSLAKAARRGRVTLIYSSHDTERNNAVALKDFLLSKLRRESVGGRRTA
jgi:uncharacterized protein YeaO (DUF488 family)